MVVPGLVALVLIVLVTGGCGGREPPAWFDPSWSPDGRSILFQVNPDPSAGCGYGACRPSIEVWVMRADGSNARRLTRGLAPAWSPDGRAIVFASWGGDIFSVHVDGTHLRRLARSHLPDHYVGPIWSPDGSKIAFVNWLLDDVYPSRSGLYVMNADGTRLRRITRRSADPSWLPDGTRIFFADEGALYTVAVEGGGLKKLFSRDRDYISTVALAPEGRTIAFTTSFDLYRIGADGRGLKRLFAGRSPDVIVWSPDGQRLAVEAQGTAIYTFAADGSGWKRLTASGSHPSWSPDGRRIAFSDGGDIYVTNADGTGERIISNANTRPG